MGKCPKEKSDFPLFYHHMSIQRVVKTAGKLLKTAEEGLGLLFFYLEQGLIKILITVIISGTNIHKFYI